MNVINPCAWLRYATLAAVFLTTGCAVQTKSNIEDDNTIGGQSQAIEAQAESYQGPRYNVGILEFRNQSGSARMAAQSTEILRTLLLQAGLEATLLSEGELAEQEKLANLQQSGAIRQSARQDYDAGFTPIDYRLSGAITSYSELEEGSNVLIAQTKTQIARVGVDYALVDPVTGQTLVAESGFGEYRKTTGGLVGLGSRSGADIGLREGALRDALGKATLSVMEVLANKPFRTSVLSVSGNTVVFRAGNRSRLAIGTTINVYRRGEAILDPDTSQILGYHQQALGTITLSSHMNDNLSSASASGLNIKAGDILEAVKR